MLEFIQILFKNDYDNMFFFAILAPLLVYHKNICVDI